MHTRPLVPIIIAALLLAGWLLGGCLSGANLSGGSIPIGGDIDGTLGLAMKATDSPAGIDVHLLNPGGVVKARTTTDAAGHFSFTQVPKGRWRLQARQGSLVADVAVDLEENDPLTVALMLAPATTPFDELRLQPAGPVITLAVGEIVTIRAEGMNGGSATPVAANWIIHGRVGNITPDGRFTAIRPGNGTLTATCGELTATVHVAVSE